MNVHSAIIRWIGAFLTQRPQRCRIAGSLSSPVFSLGGIPQGTKLAPKLFATLVNRLVSSWPLRAKYVDDTTICEVVLAKILFLVKRCIFYVQITAKNKDF